MFTTGDKMRRMGGTAELTIVGGTLGLRLRLGRFFPLEQNANRPDLVRANSTHRS